MTEDIIEERTWLGNHQLSFFFSSSSFSFFYQVLVEQSRTNYFRSVRVLILSMKWGYYCPIYRVVGLRLFDMIYLKTLTHCLGNSTCPINICYYCYSHESIKELREAKCKLNIHAYFILLAKHYWKNKHRVDIWLDRWGNWGSDRLN